GPMSQCARLCKPVRKSGAAIYESPGGRRIQDAGRWWIRRKRPPGASIRRLYILNVASTVPTIPRTELRTKRSIEGQRDRVPSVTAAYSRRSHSCLNVDDLGM